MNAHADGKRQNLFFEDLSVGQKFLSGTHRIDAGEITAFARLYDPQPFHLDADEAAPTFFGGLAASGWMTAGVTMRLIVDSVPLAGGVIGAGGEIAWPRPTRPGDELQAESEILELTPSRSRRDRGSAIVRSITRNQRGEIVQTLQCRLILQRREDGGAM